MKEIIEYAYIKGTIAQLHQLGGALEIIGNPSALNRYFTSVGTDYFDSVLAS